MVTCDLNNLTIKGQTEWSSLTCLASVGRKGYLTVTDCTWKQTELREVEATKLNFRWHICHSILSTCSVHLLTGTFELVCLPHRLSFFLLRKSPWSAGPLDWAMVLFSFLKWFACPTGVVQWVGVHPRIKRFNSLDFRVVGSIPGGGRAGGSQ